MGFETADKKLHLEFFETIIKQSLWDLKQAKAGIEKSKIEKIIKQSLWDLKQYAN